MEAKISNIETQIDRLMQRCYVDSEVAAKTLYPERFFRPFDPIHHDIFAKVDGGSQQTCIAAPRGIGKTSVANLLIPTKAALFHQANYIVPVSATTDLAMQQSENLKQKLLSNEFIRGIFGSLQIENVDVGSKTFSKKQWIIEVGGKRVCIMPRGARQQVRGQLWGDYRPDLIIVDDLEDPENMDSEDQRKKKKDWFYGDLMGSVDPGSNDWRIIVVGTVLHQDSLLVNLLEDPNWDSVRLELCDDDFRSNAPHVKTDEECRALYDKYKVAGTVDVFFREFRNIAVPQGDDAIFQPKFFQPYIETEKNLDTDPEVERICLVDIAKTANVNSAESAFVHVAVNMRTNAIYVRDIVHGKFHFDEFYDKLIDSLKRNNTSVLGLEVTSLHEFATYPLKNELARNNMHMIEVIELHARGGANEKGKVARIRSLIPYYRKGLVFHNPTCCHVLEQQLMSFPAAKRWDVMDAFGYLTEILEIGQRFMQPLGEGAMDEGDTQAAVEREFQELVDADYYWDPLTNFRVLN